MAIWGRSSGRTCWRGETSGSKGQAAFLRRRDRIHAFRNGTEPCFAGAPASCSVWSAKPSCDKNSTPMARMIDLIRQSAVPSNVMRSASKGALTLPAGEILEILVYMTSNPVFAKDATMTLASWDEKSCLQVLKDPQTPFEVTNYFLDPKNRRPKLLPALLENPSVRESALMELAQAQSREIVDMMLASPRVRRSTDILHALGTNAHITDQEKQEIETALRNVGLDTVQIHAVLEPVEEAPAAEEGPSQYEIDNAAAIAAEEAAGKQFEIMGPIDESATQPDPVPGPITPAEAQATMAAAVPASVLAAAVPSEP